MRETDAAGCSGCFITAVVPTQHARAVVLLMPLSLLVRVPVLAVMVVVVLVVMVVLLPLFSPSLLALPTNRD